MAEFLARTDAVDSDVSFFDFYREFLELPMNTPFVWAENGFHVTEALKSKLEKYDPLKDIVLFLPEAQSLPLLDCRFWKQLQKSIPHGKKVIQYALDEKNRIPEIHFVDMTIEEIIALSSVCDSVYAYRSGMCDLIAPFVKKMTLFYPALFPHFKNRFSLNKSNISEYNIRTECKYYYLFGLFPIFKSVTLPLLKSNDWLKNDIRLLTFIPFLTINKQPAKTRASLLNIIPLLKIKTTSTKTRVYLFDFIPLLKIKRRSR